MPAYQLFIPAALQRALLGFPESIRNELQIRLENAASLPVSDARSAQHRSTIDVSGYKALIELDATRNRLKVIELFSPTAGRILPAGSKSA